MARYIGANCRLCRRAGQKLLLKGVRCSTPKCAVERKATVPGGYRSRRRLSERGIQLREKQKARHTYGIYERQFRRLFAEAERAEGVAAENFVRLLEARLDNVVYRLGFAVSRDYARQLVSHGHVTVNSKRADIPSMELKPGDVVGWSTSGKKTALHKELTENGVEVVIPSWLSLDKTNLTGTVLSVPSGGDTDIEFDANAIVEYYSR